MKTILSLLLAINIINPYTVMNDNLTGNTTFNSFVQVSYEYSTEDPSIAIQLGFTAGAVTGEMQNEFPAIYCMNLTFNFKNAVEYAEMTVNLFDPGNTAGYPALNVIGENCFITVNSRSQMTVKAYNTDVCYIKIIWSYKDVHDYFGYSALSFSYSELQSNTNDWIKNGKDYVYIYNCRLTSCTLHSDPNYTSQLNSIITATDGLEGLLTTIRNNTSYLPTISTNIDSLNSLMNTISNKLDTLDNIKWNLIETTYQGYTTDFQTYNTDTYGYHDAGYYVMNTPNFSSSVSSGIYKLTIPLGVGATTFDNVKLYQYWSDAPRQFIPDTVLYYPSRNYIMIYFTVNEMYHQWPQSNYPLCIYFNKQMYKYSEYAFKLEYILQTDENYWTVFNTMKQFAHMRTVENNLQQIISILGTTDISTTDNQNKQTVDNKFNQLIQNLTLPELPNQPSKLPFIQHLFQVYGEIINIPGLDIFKWFMGMQAIVMLLGVILK